MTAFGSYEGLVESDVPFVGTAPSHWRRMRVKQWVGINLRTLAESTPGDHAFRYIDIGAVGTGRLIEDPEPMVFEAAPSRARRVLAQGDTIVSTVRTYLKAVWFVDDTSDDLVASTGFVVLTPREQTVPKFVSYLMQSTAFTNRVSRDSIGVAYPAIAEERFGALHVVIPPFEEQAAIVKFLDHAGARIQRFVGVKREFIRQLSEQRGSVIEAIVTGREQSGARKPGPFEWLPSVPAHWEIRRAKWFFREVDERSEDGSEELLSVSHLTGVTPRSEKNVTMFKAESYVGHKLCQPGDLVINTMWAWMAALGVAEQEGIVSPAYGVYRPLDTDFFRSKFVDHLLRTRPYADEFRCRSTGIRPSRLRLYPDEFLRVPIVRPPLVEQDQMLASIADATAEIDKTIVTANRELALVDEYWTRLVADVATGKADVRSAAAELPDILPEISYSGDEELPFDAIEEDFEEEVNDD